MSINQLKVGDVVRFTRMLDNFATPEQPAWGLVGSVYESSSFVHIVPLFGGTENRWGGDFNDTFMERETGWYITVSDSTGEAININALPDEVLRALAKWRMTHDT